MIGKKQIPLLILFSVLLSRVVLLEAEYQLAENLDPEDSIIQLNSTPYTFPTQDYSFSIEASDNKSWTYMLYLDADNDIEGDAIRDFEWLEEAGGSDENISIVVLLDRIPGYDNTHGNWDGSRIYNITEDISPTTIDSQLMEDLGEVDMADPTTLTDFITYCFENFPADNYILDLWNHGHAAYGVIDDETSMTHFIVDDIQIAVNNALTTTTEEIDIISMDACDMSTIEVAWELRNLSRYFIGSETTTGGYPYKLIAERLKINPNINASSLCELMVDAYSTHYRFFPYNCLSVINQTKLADIPELFNSFVSELITTLDTSNFDDIFAFSRDLTIEFYDGNWIDLVSLIENIIFFLDNPALVLESEELLEFLVQIIVYNWQHESYKGKANGLTIYMPYEFTSYEFIADYCNRESFCENMDWQTETLWDEFLNFYWNNHLCSLIVEPEEISLDEAISGYSIVQNSIKLFRFNIWQKSIYELTCPISSGDVDIKVIKYDYSGVYKVIGGSYLINPDDGTTEKCRFYLKTGFYLILVRGKDSTSNYGLEVKECDPINLVCNFPYTQTAGSRNGDTLGHYKQDLNHYFQIEVTYGNNTFTLSNSETTNYQLKIFNEDWNELYFLPAEGFGEVLRLIYNQTNENSTLFYLEICGIDGAGEFTIEIRNPNEPTPKADLHLLVILFFLPIYTIISKRKILKRHQNK
ncbi:MAG: hypothetical protein FK730_03280 [Asgard group archaeon]|nr:hypothetical protein [Asgard group archaeon]